MEIPEILATLERHSKVFPREALEEAVRRREEITPGLLRILEHTVANAETIAHEDEDGSCFAYFYAMYLLAQFRETRAYPLVVQFARLSEETLEVLVSEFVTEDLDCVLASVCGGDTALIEALIEDPNVDEYVRGAAIDSLLCLVAAGDKTRDEIMTYFKALFDGRLERTFSEAWNSLVSCATDLYPDEVYDRICAAYEEELVDPSAVRIEEVDMMMELERQMVLDRLPTGAPVYIQDVIEEMGDWACFDRPKRVKGSKRAPLQEPKRQSFKTLFFMAVYPILPKVPSLSIVAPMLQPISQQPEIAEFDDPYRSPKVGPNDRCPCGSGKKFKKCCGRTS